jgi:hypothetical protein
MTAQRRRGRRAMAGLGLQGVGDRLKGRTHEPAASWMGAAAAPTNHKIVYCHIVVN